MLALWLVIGVGCQSIVDYEPVSPPPEKDAGADTTPPDTGPPDSAPLDGPSYDTTTDLGGMDSGGDSSVEGSMPTDGSVEGSMPTDGSVDQGAPPTVDITEIFPWARAVVDERGEWFELFNPGPGEVSLLNWRIVVSRNSHTIATDVRIPRYGYAVLAVDGRASQNGNVDVDYEYGTVIRLDNDNPERIRIERPDGSVADEVNFDVGGWGFREGQALSYLGGDKDNSGSWCGETMQWLSPDSDYGTPGGPRGCGL